MILDEQERQRFIAYLRETAHDNGLLVEQMKSLPHAEILGRKLTTEAMACRVVADMLDSTESVSVEAGR